MKILKIMLVIFFANSYLFSNNRQVNIKQKEKNTVTLVKKAIEFISKHSLEKAYDAFLQDPSWRNGELSIIIVDNEGTILLDAQNSKNIYSQINEFPKIKKVAKNGGGWIQYIKNNRVFTGYAESIYIDKRSYIIHSGFFSLSAKNDVLHAVENVNTYFQDNGINQTINAVNHGDFDQRGSILPFICTIDGTCKAFQDHPELIGVNLFKDRVANNEETIKEIHEIFDSPTKGGSPINQGWIEYILRFEKKKSFLQKINDEYFIGAGYYPEIDQNSTINLVQKAKAYIFSNGPQTAFKAFANKNGLFIKGYQDIIVFDMQGKVITTAFRPSWVGKNMLETKDEHDQPYIKKMFEQINIDDTAWISYIEKQQNWTIYAERIETPDGDYVLASGYHPYNKEEATKTLVNNTVSYFQENGSLPTFKALSTENTIFQNGDLTIFVYDMNGNCIINGSNLDLIHQNFINFEDQSGKLMITDMINTANLDDEAWLTFKINNAKRRIFINYISEDTPTKEGDLEFYRSYIIGSGYYL